MQTIGAAGSQVKRCSLESVLMSAQDGYSARGLLYLAAIPVRSCQSEHCQDRVDAGGSGGSCFRSFEISGGGQVFEKCVELRGLEPLAFWMQTMGAALLVVEQCSLVRVWMAAQGQP
jgi:hypothetical protein